MEVERSLDKLGLRNGDGKEDFTVFLSDIAPDFKHVAERILGRKIPKVSFRSV
jgi:hypothetical protein